MLTALCGSAFLYLAFWGVSNRLLESLLALGFFALLLSGDRRRWFWSGFFLGLLWFYWIGISFLHYGHPWAIPFVDLAIALVYGLYFWLFAWLSDMLTQSINRSFSILHSPFSIHSSYLKGLALLSMSYAHPLGFDWFKPELVLVHSYFGVDKGSFALLLAGVLLIRDTFQRSRRPKMPGRILFSLAALFCFFSALDLRQPHILPSDPSGRIVLVSTRVPVEHKWQRAYLRPQIETVFQAIDKAIREKARLVILPESVLPFFLNTEAEILQPLLQRSRRIDIILGALYLSPGGEHRNSAYLFQRGHFQVADKAVLVPFGEANPLPHWAGKWINRIFFDGAPDYRPAAHPGTFTIEGRKYHIGVCYEGTSERLYTDRPKRLILISNNGWLHPSVEPTLQRLLLEY
ncbi:apolipoprotein N-acyltransferase, partial [Nitratifractor sp.]|uniref:apolipoprotein N-acyltransferase n=1 Tax=Nitratifractor sp. TaxID=2268144 RepID=UPI0025D8DC44